MSVRQPTATMLTRGPLTTSYTQTGINLTFKLCDHWLYQIGLSAGNDLAPWVDEADRKPALNSCVGYTWSTAG